MTRKEFAERAGEIARKMELQVDIVESDRAISAWFEKDGVEEARVFMWTSEVTVDFDPINVECGI